MRTKSKLTLISILFLGLTLLCGILLGVYQIAGTEYIEIVRPFSDPLSNYKSARIKQVGDRGYAVDDQIFLWLVGQNIEHVYDEKYADLEVRCENEKGWMLPVFGRHFDIIAEGYKKISINLVDNKSGEVLGEVRYKRPLLKLHMPHIHDRMLDKLTNQAIGLTDFSTWEKRKFPNSKLIVDLPVGFRNVQDRKDDEDLLFLWMHPMPFENGNVHAQLFIQITRLDLGKMEDERKRILGRPDSNNDPIYRERYDWELSFQPNFSSKPEFKSIGPYRIFLRDIRTRTGEIIRARASLNTKLRPEGPALDESAIKRIFESLEIYSP